MRSRRRLLSIVALCAPILAACASGSAIVTGKTRPPLAANQVRIYLEPPTSYETIGLVAASSDAGWTEQASVNYAVEELKSQAAKLGANGVLLGSTGDRTTSFTTTLPGGVAYAVPVVAKTIQGKAIFVPVQ
jgi:hypothetical protein